VNFYASDSPAVIAGESLAFFPVGNAVAVAKALGCSRSQAYKLKKDTEPAIVGHQRQAYIPKKRGRKSQPQLREARREMVRNLLTGQPELQQVAVAEFLPVPVHQSTIARDIKAIGWSRKRFQIIPFERNSHQNVLRRRQYAEMLTLVNDNRLIFIDETGHNLHLSTIYGYSAAGQPDIQMVNANRGKNLTAIVAISIGGMLHYKLVDGAANGVIFADFLGELQPLLPPQSVVIMDNVRFHHGNLVQQWAAANNHAIRVEYLPPYSPELNPIEEFFHMHKSSYRKINHPIARNRQVMRDRVVASLETLRNVDLSGIFQHMHEFLAMAYAGHPFV
jgi:transposase